MDIVEMNDDTTASEGGSFADLVRRENDILDLRFVESDILDPRELWQRLESGEGEVCRGLGDLLDRKCRWLAATDPLWRPEGKRRVRVLVDVLNTALELETLGGAGAPEVRAEVSGVRERWRLKGEPVFLVNRLLIEREFPDSVRRWEEKVPQLSEPGHAQEPWVAFTAADRFGLALSGGGVRSATFNLGLLQALEEKGILGRVEYLATVSGGGYVGGFWTRWRRARAEDPSATGAAAGVFPRRSPHGEGVGAAGKVREIREPREIRHLREFSRFLIPRGGLSAEFWSAVATVLGGLVTSLAAAVVVVSGIVALWLCVGVVPFGLQARWLPPEAVLAAVVAVALISSGREAHRLEVVEPGRSARRYWRAYGAGAVLAVAMTVVALLWLPGARPEKPAATGTNPKPVATAPSPGEPQAGGVALAMGPDGVVLRWLPGPTPEDRTDGPGPGELPAWAEVLRPSVALLWTLAAMALGQLALGRFQCARRRIGEAFGSSRWSAPCSLPGAALSLVMGRLLAVTTGWTGLAGLWVLACQIVEHGEAYDMGELGVGTAGVTLIFYYVRDWLRKPKAETAGRGLLEKLLARLGGGGTLKTAMVRLLAAAAVVLICLVVMVTVRWLWVPPTADAPALSAPLLPVSKWLYPGAVATACGGVLFLILWWYDPAALGMHEFYRSRITRCFLGAGRVRVATAEPGRAFSDHARAVVERSGDDMPLHADSGLPFHLVCCAANQTTAEDQLVTLHRGARSVVLSRLGIAWGDHWAETRTLWLSSAVTASAAAFNSLMGERSMVLGRMVSFLMTALNLRLGLWVRNPAARGRTRWWSELFPGVHFLRELAGRARCTADGTSKAYLHLSDGGHFENLALYELVRRHCRFIVVSDAGADPQSTFDDFGRATRRVREDFGVEIEIDLDPLKPSADGRAKQHLAVGTIHYDGVTGTDKGTIVYCKPVLTGDEPPDVLQYGRTHPAFPHESTGDQFFDEAQFESYRRLGEHAINAALRPLERLALDPSTTPDETIFWRLQLAWRGVPWMQNEDGIRLWENALKFDEELGGERTGDWSRRYLGFAAKGAGALSNPECQEALWAVRVCKLMEEAWVTCELELHWSDSRASGWMSALHRWAAMPAVRTWWPAIKPLFGDDFQVFAEQQLHLPGLGRPWTAENGSATADEVQPLAAMRLAQLYSADDCREMRVGRRSHQLVLRLPRPEDGRPLALQIGLAFVQEAPGPDGEPASATWAIEDLFLVPEFAVGDFQGRALDGLIGYYEGKGYPHLKVILDGPEWNKALFGQRALRDQASRRRHTEMIGLYRSRGFCYDAAAMKNGRCVGMFRRLVKREPSLADETGNLLVLQPIGPD